MSGARARLPSGDGTSTSLTCAGQVPSLLPRSPRLHTLPAFVLQGSHHCIAGVRASPPRAGPASVGKPTFSSCSFVPANAVQDCSTALQMAGHHPPGHALTLLLDLPCLLSCRDRTTALQKGGHQPLTIHFKSAHCPPPPLPLLCRDRITALQMSADCRWLLSASMDGTLRVWDVPAAQCLQVRAEHLWGPKVGLQSHSDMALQRRAWHRPGLVCVAVTVDPPTGAACVKQTPLPSSACPHVKRQPRSN